MKGEMAQRRYQTNKDKFSCSICLDLLEDPVKIPCGHNYCMNCIKDAWDKDQRKIHNCPQCLTTFTIKPELMKNAVLAEFVEDFKTKVSVKQQENICPRHYEVMKIFCRTDQQCICFLCFMDQHKDHDTVSAAEERKEKQRELKVSRRNIQQRIQDREKDVKLLQQEVKDIDHSADKEVEDIDKIFIEMISLFEKRRSDVKQQIRSQQRTEVSRVRELQEKMELEITELKRKDAELDRLSHTDDNTQFLHNYPSLSLLSEPTDSPRTKTSRQWSFKNVTAAVAATRDQIQVVLSEKLQEPEPKTRDQIQVVLSEKQQQPEPKTRDEFLQYSRQITMDPNTAHKDMVLSNGNREITHNIMKYDFKDNGYPPHPDRFTNVYQVLSRDGLTGRCYWEVEMSGDVHIAVSYKSIRRTWDSSASGFGYNEKSWALCYESGSTSSIFKHKNIPVYITQAPSYRVGVYLDHSAGSLSFYSVSDTMTLLHRVQTTFTEPLYPGLCLPYYGDTAEIL